MKKLLFLLAFPLFGQVINPVLVGTTAPSGTCPNRRLYIETDNSSLWFCVLGTWTNVVASGGSGTVTSVGGDGHFTITNPTTAPNIAFNPLANDYDFSQLTGTSAVALWSAGAGAPVGVCIAGRDRYLDTTNSDEWFCSATNTWRKNLSTTNTGVLAIT